MVCRADRSTYQRKNISRRNSSFRILLPRVFRRGQPNQILQIPTAIALCAHDEYSRRKYPGSISIYQSLSSGRQNSFGRDIIKSREWGLLLYCLIPRATKSWVRTNYRVTCERITLSDGSIGFVPFGNNWYFCPTQGVNLTFGQGTRQGYLPAESGSLWQTSLELKALTMTSIGSSKLSRSWTSIENYLQLSSYWIGL